MGLTLDPLDPYAGRSNGSDGSRLDPGGWRLVAGGWWLVAGGWWLVAGGWGCWLLVVDSGCWLDFCPRNQTQKPVIHQHDFLWTAQLF